MNTKLIWIFGAVVVAVLVVIGLFVLLSPKQASTGTPATGSGTEPFGAPAGSVTTGSGVTGKTGSGTLSVAGSGGSVTTKDFIHNGVTQQQPQNPSFYLIAGSLGSCTGCNAAPTADFNIGYNSTDHSFTISLSKEPIGASRLEAQSFFLDTLGITKVQACTLKVTVSVPYFVNDTYDGENLGLSFCPGATPLPN